jgi:hypothetical protein
LHRAGGFAVAVYVGNRHEDTIISARAVSYCWLKGAVSVAQQYADAPVRRVAMTVFTIVGDDQIEVAIAPPM